MEQEIHIIVIANLQLVPWPWKHLKVTSGRFEILQITRRIAAETIIDYVESRIILRSIKSIEHLNGNVQDSHGIHFQTHLSNKKTQMHCRFIHSNWKNMNPIGIPQYYTVLMKLYDVTIRENSPVNYSVSRSLIEWFSLQGHTTGTN